MNTPAPVLEIDVPTLIVYEGAPHGLTGTHRDRLNADLLAFVKS